MGPRSRAERQAEITALHHQTALLPLSPDSLSARRNCLYALKYSRGPCFQGRIGTGMVGSATVSGSYACSPMQHCEHKR